MTELHSTSIVVTSACRPTLGARPALRWDDRGLLKASIGSPPHPLDPLPTLRGEGDAPTPSRAGNFVAALTLGAAVLLAPVGAAAGQPPAALPPGAYQPPAPSPAATPTVPMPPPAAPGAAAPAAAPAGAPQAPPGTAAGTIETAPAGEVERITFRAVIDRALSQNTTVLQAVAEVLRAEALVQQTRASSLPQVNAAAAYTRYGYVIRFGPVIVQPHDVKTENGTISVPLVNLVSWAQWAHALDNKTIAELSVADAKRRVATAAANAYLTVIARRRTIDADQLALETARAHYNVAHQRQVAGAASRLEEVQAAQDVSNDEVLVEQAMLDLRRAQEALGVLLSADGPFDAADEPVFADLPRRAASRRSAPMCWCWRCGRPRPSTCCATAGATGCRRSASPSRRACNSPAPALRCRTAGRRCCSSTCRSTTAACGAARSASAGRWSTRRRRT